jgi:hypothetical protein
MQFGEATYITQEGERPMAITGRLDHPRPGNWTASGTALVSSCISPQVVTNDGVAGGALRCRSCLGPVQHPRVDRHRDARHRVDVSPHPSGTV